MYTFNNIKLNRHSNTHLYVQLYNEIKILIKENKLKANSKLPSIRYLAEILELNNSTVVNSYRLLEQEGYIYKKIGSGSYVKNQDVTSSISKKEIKKKTRYDFSNNAPDDSLFPVNSFKILFNEILDRDGGGAFNYQDSKGYFPLRESIVKYIKQLNIKTNVENIQIISGAQQGIDIISKTLIDYGDTVITESPTYSGAIYAFKSRSAKIIEIPIDRDGIDIKILESKISLLKPKIIYVMPNYQNPTGFSYSDKVKKEILNIAHKYNIYIIEDDFLSEIPFKSKKHFPIKSFDYNDRVIYIKSFSKTFMPGLRLGFVILPLGIQQKFLLGKHFTDISTSGFIQRVFDLYLKRGLWRSHINSISIVYNNKFNNMMKLIKKYKPTTLRYYRPSGGLNFWFSLPDGYSSQKLEKYLEHKDILISSGSRFLIDNRDTEYFRLSIASIDSENMEIGIMNFFNHIKLFLENECNKMSFFNKKNFML